MRSLLLVLLLITVEQVCSANIQATFQGIDPADLVTIGNETFYISPQESNEMSVSEAQIFCGDAGMKLISFQTEEKWTMISEYLRQNGYSYSHWSSGYEVPTGRWHWSGVNEPIKHFEWASNQPDNYYEFTDCLRFNHNIGWYDDDCNDLFHFICEF